MADIAHKMTDKKIAEMEKRLSAIYSRAGEEIGVKWKDYIKESDNEIDELQKLYDSAKDEKLKRKYGIQLSQAKKERTIFNKRFKDLTVQTAAELSNVNKTALAYINDQLPEVYTLNYNALYPAVENFGGYSFTLTDANTVKYLAEADRNLLPYKKINGKKDVRWNTQKINAEVMQGILQGESMGKIAERFTNVLEMDEVSAIRNARTTVTSAECKGRQDSYERAKDDGIDIKKQWMATLDFRTRHSHALLDGQTVEVDKPFKSELGEIMYPADPNAAPANVYNCRCTTIADVGQEKSESRIARDDNGRSVKVENMTYEEWYKWKTGKPFVIEVPKVTSAAKQLNGIRKELGEKFVDDMQDILEKASNKNLRDMYYKYGNRIKVNETNLKKGAFFSPFDKGIHINAVNVAKGDTCHLPYQTAFHEFGHNIDYLGGIDTVGYPYMSMSYKGGILPDLIKQDYKVFKKSMGARSNAILIDMLKAEKMDFHTCGNLSDILEGCTNTSYPLGVGHGASYHKRFGATAKEFFAEVCDSSASSPEELAQLRRVFPNAVALVEEMMEVLLK